MLLGMEETGGSFDQVSIKLMTVNPSIEVFLTVIIRYVPFSTSYHRNPFLFEGLLVLPTEK